MEARTYKVSDADLKQMADSLANRINRDALDFATRNIDTNKVDALKVLIDQFDNTTTDPEMHGLVMVASDTKDAIIESIRKAVRNIRNMAVTAYDGVGKYHTFGFIDTYNSSNDAVYRLAKRVARVAERLMADLAAHGLTATHVSTLEALAIQLNAAMDNMDDAIINRTIEAIKRVGSGNALWAEMIRLASIGKSLYKGSNEAKYNDYVLIGSNASAA
jgi:DNA-binding phage protein